MIDFSVQRQNLIGVLKAKGISNPAVLEAMGTVPRHKFIPRELRNQAYENIALPIGRDQTISRPYTVAFQTSLLDVKPGEKVLEIGTGSGYQTAVLNALKALICTIERQKDLFDRTANLFKDLDIYPLYCHLGDGFSGLSNYAPFDKIIVTAAAPFVPPKLKAQLRVGGRMVLPLVSDHTRQEQMMISITRESEDVFVTQEYDFFSFVPMLKNIEGF